MSEFNPDASDLVGSPPQRAHTGPGFENDEGRAAAEEDDGAADLLHQEPTASMFDQDPNALDDPMFGMSSGEGSQLPASQQGQESSEDTSALIVEVEHQSDHHTFQQHQRAQPQSSVSGDAPMIDFGFQTSTSSNTMTRSNLLSVNSSQTQPSPSHHLTSNVVRPLQPHHNQLLSPASFQQLHQQSLSSSSSNASASTSNSMARKSVSFHPLSPSDSTRRSPQNRQTRSSRSTMQVVAVDPKDVLSVVCAGNTTPTHRGAGVSAAAASWSLEGSSEGGVPRSILEGPRLNVSTSSFPETSTSLVRSPKSSQNNSSASYRGGGGGAPFSTLLPLQPSSSPPNNPSGPLSAYPGLIDFAVADDDDSPDGVGGGERIINDPAARSMSSSCSVSHSFVGTEGILDASRSGNPDEEVTVGISPEEAQKLAEINRLALNPLAADDQADESSFTSQFAVGTAVSLAQPQMGRPLGMTILEVAQMRARQEAAGNSYINDGAASSLDRHDEVEE